MEGTTRRESGSNCLSIAVQHQKFGTVRSKMQYGILARYVEFGANKMHLDVRGSACSASPRETVVLIISAKADRS